MASNVVLQKIDDYRWRIPKSYMEGMRVDGIIYANEKLLEQAKSDEALQQVANVAHLPGIVKHSLAMPDLHWGYGFVIGGVAATDPQADGVVSPVVSVMILIAVCDWYDLTLMRNNWKVKRKGSSVNSLIISLAVSGLKARYNFHSTKNGIC